MFGYSRWIHLSAIRAKLDAAVWLRDGTVFDVPWVDIPESDWFGWVQEIEMARMVPKKSEVII